MKTSKLPSVAVLGATLFVNGALEIGLKKILNLLESFCNLNEAVKLNALR